MCRHNNPDPDLIPVPDEVDLKLLGLAVIAQAIEDIQNDVPKLCRAKSVLAQRLEEARVRDEAIAFLIKPNDSLAFWCTLAELKPEVVNERAIAILEKKHGSFNTQLQAVSE